MSVMPTQAGIQKSFHLIPVRVRPAIHHAIGLDRTETIQAAVEWAGDEIGNLSE